MRMHIAERLTAFAWITAAVLVAAPAAAQYMYLDVDGDATRTMADVRGRAGQEKYGLYLVTDQLRTGGASPLSTSGCGALTIGSYEVIFRAVGGEVEWVGYANEQPSMPIQVKSYQGMGDFYVGFAGNEALPPGRHRLGTLQVRTKSGAPKITMAASTPLRGTLNTSFGSHCEGRDRDHTLKLASSPEMLEGTGDGLGDWADADGVYLPVSGRSGVASAPNVPSSREPVFRAVWKAQPRNMGAGVLMVETPTRGRLSVHLFDVQGRLVRTLLRRSTRAAGIHEFQLADEISAGEKLAASICFYRVEFNGTVATGKAVVLP